MYTNVNGKLCPTDEAVVPADSRGLWYGWGVFETMLWRDGDVRLWGYHMDRLWAGMMALGFELPVLMTQEHMWEEVMRTVRKNNMDALCRVRLQVYADGGGMLDGTPKPGYVIECYAIDRHITEMNEHGLVLGIADGVHKSNDSLANLKTTNALVYAMAGLEAKKQKWNDALVLNEHGRIIESTIANIFWVKDGVMYTVPLSEGCVAGVMRRHVMERMEVQEMPLTRELLSKADAVVLTNAVRGVKWVERIGEWRYGRPGAEMILGFSGF